MPDAVPTSARFQMVPLAQLSESTLNPRKDFDDARLAELVESVKTKGVLEPLVVRQVGKGYEVAAGARRYRAAKAAGLKQVPAMVWASMSDAELLEVAILENVVRADISPLEEGEAYRQLVRQHGYTVDQLVEKTGKSRTVVFARMKLADLQGPARELVLAGKLSASVGELLARLPTAETQAKALEALENEAYVMGVELAELPVREAKARLDGEFRLKLKEAPFDTAAADLVDAPPCHGCPKRTGADKEAFADVKDDTCLDGECWAAKAAAAFKRLRAEYKEEGKTLLKDGEKLFDSYAPNGLSYRAREKYAKPADKVVGDKSWKELLGKETPIAVAIDAKGKEHQLVDKKAAVALLKEKNPKAAEKLEKGDAGGDDWKARNAKAEQARATATLVTGLVRQKALAAYAKPEAALELLLLSLAASPWDWKQLCAAAGLPEKTKLAGLKPAQKARLLVAEAFRGATYDGDAAVTAAAAKKLRLDVKALKKKAAAAEKGTCFVCGCTEEKACDCGCEWANDAQTLCSACAAEE